MRPTAGGGNRLVEVGGFCVNLTALFTYGKPLPFSEPKGSGTGVRVMPPACTTVYWLRVSGVKVVVTPDDPAVRVRLVQLLSLSSVQVSLNRLAAVSLVRTLETRRFRAEVAPRTISSRRRQPHVANTASIQVYQWIVITGEAMPANTLC